MTLIFILNIIFFFKFLTDFFIIKLSKKRLYIYNLKQFYSSLIIIILFLIIFFFFFRVLNLFVHRSIFFDLKSLMILYHQYGIVNIVIFITLLFFFRKMFYIFIRIHYLRIHYFYFLRFYIYETLFFFFKNLNLFFIKICFNKKIILFLFFFFLKNFFKIVFIVFFIRAIIFNNFIMYTGFLPYYVIYYFLFNCIKYLQLFESSFDKGIVKLYYPDFFGVTVIGFSKIHLYSNKLITGTSNYFFVTSSLLKYNEFYPENWIFFEYENLKYFNIFIINKKIKPSF